MAKMNKTAANVFTRFASLTGSLLVGGFGLVVVSLLIPDMWTPHGSTGDSASIGDFVILFGVEVYKHPWVGLVALVTILLASAAWEIRIVRGEARRLAAIHEEARQASIREEARQKRIREDVARREGSN